MLYVGDGDQTVPKGFSYSSYKTLIDTGFNNITLRKLDNRFTIDSMVNKLVP